MTQRGSELLLNDFSGGLHTTAAVTELNFNEATDLSNVVVGPNGDYFRTRYANTAFNSSAMNSGANVQGLGYYKVIAGTEYLVSICGNKIFKSDDLDGTMDDITGAVTITDGQNNLWTHLTFNNIHIMFGGSATSPDAPLQWNASGNAAALAGSPPSAYGAVQGNNRVFAFRTAAAPSIVQWSILGSGQDWTGTGSGSQNISTSDNDSVTAMAVLNNSLALVFKQNSIHKLLINTLVSGAFPTFPLAFGTGCVGKHACVVADGLCYFITPQAKMKVTDGERIIDEYDLPQLSYVDDLWSDMNPARLQYIQGKHLVGEDYSHVGWLMTSTTAGTTHDWLLIWDIRNKCWLRHKTGWKMNVMTTTQSGAIYTGNYAGKIFKQDVSSVTTDASESSATVDSSWTSGWLTFGSLETIKIIKRFFLSYVTQTFGNINVSWGFNFSSNQRTVTLDQKTNGGVVGQFVVGVGLVGGQSDEIKKVNVLGNGRVFQYRIRNNDHKMKINSINLIVNKAVKSKLSEVA